MNETTDTVDETNEAIKLMDACLADMDALRLAMRSCKVSELDAINAEFNKTAAAYKIYFKKVYGM